MNDATLHRCFDFVLGDARPNAAPAPGGDRRGDGGLDVGGVGDRALAHQEHGAVQFADWLYETSNDDWGDAEALHLELLDIDCRTPHAESVARAILRRELEARQPGELARRRAGSIARGLLDRRIDPVDACRALARLHHEGVAAVAVIWVGFDSELDVIPPPDARAHWSAGALARAMAQLKAYHPRILAEAAALLRALDDAPDPAGHVR